MESQARWRAGPAPGDPLASRWTVLREQLGLTKGELTLWRETALRMVTGRAASGVIEQFDGFFKLEVVDLTTYAGRTAPMDVVLGPERTQHAQVIKQADVVMLLALLWEQQSPETRVAHCVSTSHGVGMAAP